MSKKQRKTKFKGRKKEGRLLKTMDGKSAMRATDDAKKMYRIEQYAKENKIK